MIVSVENLSYHKHEQSIYHEKPVYAFEFVKVKIQNKYINTSHICISINNKIKIFYKVSYTIDIKVTY